MNFVKTKMWVLFMASVFMAVLGCSKGKENIRESAPVAIRVVKPERVSLKDKISYVGTVQAHREVRVISRVQGTILSLPVAEGNKVHKGQVVARIFAPELDATVRRLQAEVDYWKRRYEADQRLEKEKAIPPEQVAMSKRAFLSASAALEGARANLDKTVERAPFDGEVLKWLVDPGQPVMPGQPVLILGDNQTEVQVEVIEEDLKRGLRVGTPVLLFRKDGSTLESQVREIAPQASGISRTFIVKVAVPQKQSQGWRKGESVRTEFVLKSAPNALAVPVDAIADRDVQPHIFLVREGKAFRQEVTVGIQQGNLVQVDFPYNGQDEVAVTNLGLLKDGIPVFTVETGEVGQ